MRLRVLLALSVLLCPTAAVAGLKEGYAALSKKDYVTAANEYRPLAERGDPEAQYRIGRLYEFGNGYPQDKAQGIAWIRKAAAQNHADAQQELGVVYATGDGVKQDDVQAVAWFRKAQAPCCLPGQVRRSGDVRALVRSIRPRLGFAR